MCVCVRAHAHVSAHKLSSKARCEGVYLNRPGYLNWSCRDRNRSHALRNSLTSNLHYLQRVDKNQCMIKQVCRARTTCLPRNDNNTRPQFLIRFLEIKTKQKKTKTTLNHGGVCVSGFFLKIFY